MVYNQFRTLEDAIHCCIASSHVPFIMGDMFRKYRNLYTIDGGFSGNPYYGECHIDGNDDHDYGHDCGRQIATLHVHPFIWYGRNVTAIEYCANQFKLFVDLFQIGQMNFSQLYHMGYEDAKLNRKYFDNIIL